LIPRYGQAGVDAYQSYVDALSPFKDASRKELLCMDNRMQDYLRMTDEVAQALLRLDSAPIQWPAEDIDHINLFPNGVDILNTRAKIWAARAEKPSAALELGVALRFGMKLRKAQGPMIVWLCGVACEYRTLRALKCVLSGITSRDLKSQLWKDFPSTVNQRLELADVWRAEFIYFKSHAQKMPLDEMVKDYVKIGWFMRRIDESKESAWPLEQRIFDLSATMPMAEEICRSQVEWWEGGAGSPPRYDHLWQGVPEPPKPGADSSRFRQIIAGIENPLGKHTARRLSQGAWMGRTACAVRSRKLAVTRFLYAFRSASFSELMYRD
jgi:hypothetical protein